jgi:hypothetical protein
LFFGKILSKTALFFLKFSKLSRLCWLVYPTFSYKFYGNQITQRLKQTAPLKIEVENYEQ